MLETWFWDWVPVSTADDKETGEKMLVTQYEGSVIEEPRPLVILDEHGHPLSAGDNARRFFEASWMHKYTTIFPPGIQNALISSLFTRLTSHQYYSRTVR